MGNVERIELAPGLEISRVLTGLWQVADMERDGGVVDTAAAAAEMRRYVEMARTSNGCWSFVLNHREVIYG